MLNKELPLTSFISPEHALQFMLENQHLSVMEQQLGKVKYETDHELKVMRLIATLGPLIGVVDGYRKGYDYDVLSSPGIHYDDPKLPKIVKDNPGLVFIDPLFYDK